MNSHADAYPAFVTASAAASPIQAAPSAAGPSATRKSTAHSSWSRLWYIALGCAAGLFFGLVIYVKTNQGTLTIQSPRDDLQLEILQAGEIYKQVTMHKGEKSWTVGLGEYEVKLVGPADGLTVENGKFSMRRGEEVIATIWASPKEPRAAETLSTVSESSLTSRPAETAESPTGPRYENQTLRQWRDVFLHERSPNRRGQAVQAMLALADSDNQNEVVDAIYEHSTLRERSDEFRDEIRNKVSSIRQLLRDFVHDDTQSKIYVMKRWLEEDQAGIADGFQVLLKLKQPRSAEDRQYVQHIIDNGLTSDNDEICFAAATCALHHANWLPDVSGRIRRSIASSESQRRKAQLTFLLTLMGEATESDQQFYLDLVTRTPADAWSLDVGLAGLIWIGPEAKSAARPLMELLRERRSGPVHEFFFARAVDHPMAKYVYQHFFHNPPNHVASTPLLRQGNWGRTSGSHLDAIVTALGCIGKDDPEVAEFLHDELVDMRDQQHITWISPVFDRATTIPSLEMSIPCLVHSLTQVAPNRYANANAVWESVLGPKRIPVVVKSKSTWISPSLVNEIEARLIAATKDLPVRDPSFYVHGFEDTLLPATRNLHPVLTAAEPRIRLVNNRLEFEFRFRYPAARVRTTGEPSLCLVDMGGTVLRQDWYSEAYLEPGVPTLPIVNVGELEGIAPGERWENANLVFAIDIANRIANVLWKSNLTTIRLHPKDANQFQIVNDSGSWTVDWGHAIGKEPIGEPSHGEKIKALEALLGDLYQSKTPDTESWNADLVKAALGKSGK